jgi:hypothetical protein
MVLGAGIGHSTNSALNPAEILSVTDTIILELGLEPAQYNALLWATVNDDTQVDSTVWVEIRPPSLILNPNATGSVQADLNTTKVPMVLVDHGLGKRYEVSVPNFTENGRYEIFYFVRDKITLKLAPMKRSAVYHKIAGNPSPTAAGMTNTEPLPGSQQGRSVYFSWGKVIDAHPPITYSLFISTNPTPDYANATYIQENIPVNRTVIGPEAGLELDRTYYWKIRTIDRYGAYSDSIILSFDTPSLNNADVVVLMGTVQDAATSQPIRAQVQVNGEIAVADVDGSYYVNLGSTGTFTVITNADGYGTDSRDISIESQGRLTVFSQNIALDSAPLAATHSINVTVHGINGGTGTVSSTPGGISCQAGSIGTCSASFPNAQNINLSAPASAGSLFSGWSGDCNGSGTCAFDMSSNRNVTATFTKTPPFYRPAHGDYSYDLQGTYDTAGSSDIIQMQATAPISGFNATLAKSITLKGGYDADFHPTPADTSCTIIQGKLTVKAGTVLVERVKVR